MVEDQNSPQASIVASNSEVVPVASEPAQGSTTSVASKSDQQAPVSQPLSSASAFQPTYAGFWVRVAAIIIDSIILGIPIYVASSLIGLILIQLNVLSKGNSILNLLIVVFWIPTVVFFVTRYGATPGKMYYGLKIGTSEGTYPKIGRALLREVIGKVLSGLIFDLGYIWAAFDKKKQALHDKIAGTYVVVTKPIVGFRKALIFIFGALILVAIPLLGILFAVVLMAVNPAKRVGQARDAARKNDIGKISTELQSYYFNNNNRYPLSLSKLEVSAEIKSLPKDPSGLSYSYSVLPDGSEAAIYANLEKGNLGNNSVWCWKSSSVKADEVASASDCQP